MKTGYWTAIVATLALAACGCVEGTIGGVIPGQAANVDGEGGGGLPAGGGGSGGSGGSDAEPPDDTIPTGPSAYPKINLLSWGGGSPAWYAEFDWVIFPATGLGLQAKQLNPDLKVSLTRDWNCCRYQGETCPVPWRVRDKDGNFVEAYSSSCYLGDTTDHCGEYDGKTYREHIVEWTQAVDWENVDGWNSDGIWDNIAWKADVDIDGDGDSDSADNDLWRQGRLKLFQEVREAMPEDRLMTLWAGITSDFWGQGPDYLNGVGAEKLMVFTGWERLLEVYQTYSDSAVAPHHFFINNHYEGDPDSGSESRNNFRFMRFGLATTLLHDGYYSYEDGDGLVHNEHWWVRYFDEYDVPLGDPLAEHVAIADDVFCRFFSGGAVLLNGSAGDVTITEADLMAAAAQLGLDWATVAGEDGHLYRFAGQQDPTFNDGSVLDAITLSSKVTNVGWGGESRKGDGILLVQQPNLPVVAPIYLDTQRSATSPGAETATLQGFEGDCGANDSKHRGFRTGYHYCSSVNPVYGWARSATGNGDSATFATSVVHEGNYHVYEFHPEMGAHEVPHTITHADGVDVVLVDQRVGVDRWNLLGTYRLTPDTALSVVISDQAAGDTVAADAIRVDWAGKSQSP